MKKNDIAALVLIVMLSAAISYVVANSIIGSPETNPVQVEVVSPINETFPAPDPRIFNENAIDPTVDIKAGSEETNKPFSNQ